MASFRRLPMRVFQVLRTGWRRVCPPAACLLLASLMPQWATAQSVANGSAIWNNAATYFCYTCHGVAPVLPQRNAGGAVSVLDSAITNNSGAFMNYFKAAAIDGTDGTAPLSASQRADVAAYLGSLYATSQSTSVNYGASTTITLANIATTTAALAVSATPSQVINSISTVAAPARGTLGAYNLANSSVSYTHTATSCTADSFTFRGTGLSGAATTTRTVNITVNAPAPPGATTTGSPFGIAYNTAATNIPLTLSGGTATGLTITSGLSPNVGTLTVTGTSLTYTASASTYAPSVTFSYRADGPCASSAPVSVTINVAAPPVPVITSANSTTGTGGQAFSFPVTASNAPTGFAATGLPAGLTINPTTGLISGTPTVSGPFTAMVTASNGTGPSLTQALSINIGLVAPVITSPLTANATSGAPFVPNYTIAASNLPANFNATGLPSGLTVDTNTGVISGTPVVVMGGPVNVTISASNAAGTDTRTLVLTVALNPPTITSANSASGNVGQAFTFSVTATDFPSGYVATGLPAGLAINPTTGAITGTPTLAGVYPVMLTATNGSGNGTQTLTITIILLPPVVSSPATASGTLTQPFTYAISASNAPTSYGATGLPPGLTVNTTSGAITGTPTTAGTYNAIVSAMNASGTGTRAVTITISNLPPPSAGGVNLGVPYGSPTVVDLGAATGGNYNSVTITVQPLHGTLTLNGLVATYTPAAGYSGPDSFVYTATGPGGTSAPATVNVTVALPPAPKANAKTAAVAFNTATAINLATSITGVATTVAITRAPAHGTASISGLVATYTPTAGYFGTDSFAYTATGPGGTSEAGEVSITVGSSAPTVRAVRFILPLNTPTTMDMAPFISGSAISGITVVTNPKYGTASVNGTKVTYAPATDFFGDDSFTYAAFGNAGASPAAAVSVTVVGRPDPSREVAVSGIVTAQADAANRFARAQIGNFQSRMESLHRSNGAGGNANPRPGSGKTAVARAAVPVDRTTVGTLDDSASAPKPGMLRVGSTASTTPRDSTAVGRSEANFPFASEVASLLTSRSVNVAGIAGDGAGSSHGSGPGTTNFWTAGTANFGVRDANGTRSALDFTTSGLSIGVDRRISKAIVLGMGLGFARDRTDIGTDGSNSRARGVSAIAYGSFQPGQNTFIDGLLGYGSLDYKTRRYVSPISDFASGNRDGSQLFGSIAAGYEYRDSGLMFSPYARLDYISDRLKQSSESGAGLYALTYFSQTTPSMQGAIGVRAETLHQTSFGWAAPRARVEYRHEFQGERHTGISYADLASAGAQYLIATGPVARHALMVGMGTDFQFKGGLTVGLDYQLLHTSPRDSSQGLRLTISQELDGRGAPLFGSMLLAFGKPRDIQFDAGYMFDDNVTRAKSRADKLSDRAYSANVGKGLLFTFADYENIRAKVSYSVGGEKFTTFRGLNRAMAGFQGQVDYRASGAFDAPTFAVAAEGTGEYFDSEIRRGYRYQVSASVRQQLTDRIGLFAALAYCERVAKSAVFSNRHVSLRLNADYAVTRDDTFYMTGEFRRGQIFSGGRPSLDNLDVADVFILDDAFPGGQYFSYRFDADSVISTLGYNMGFGPRHSLDFSWRRAQSTPRQKSFVSSGSSSYVADQYSIVYLIRF